MSRKITIQTGDPDYDGFMDIDFVDIDGNVTTHTGIDVNAVKEEVDALIPDGCKGTEFLDRVRKFILAKFNVSVNLGGASRFYEAVADYMKEMLKDVFSQGLSSPASTDSTPAPSATPKLDTTSDVETKSEPVNS